MLKLAGGNVSGKSRRKQFLIDWQQQHKNREDQKKYQFWHTPRRRGCCSNFWDKCEVPWRQPLLYCLRLKYDCEKNHWDSLPLFALELSPWGSFPEWHLCGWNIGKIIYLHNLLFLHWISHLKFKMCSRPKENSANICSHFSAALLTMKCATAAMLVILFPELEKIQYDGKYLSWQKSCSCVGWV